MMLHKEEPVGPHGIMEVIATLAAKGASGRLEIVAGGTDGALLFTNGKLVDARIGHLTGFQAMNAVASMRNASFRFDPTVAVAPISFISPSERLVLKQFFGIETADPRDYPAPIIEPPAVISEPAVTTATYHGRPKFRYLAVFALFVLFVAVAIVAVLFREKFRQRSSTVATKIESISPPATDPVVPEKSPATTTNLTGDWNIVNTVRTSSYRSFQNLRIGFALSINQTGNTFTAKGQKISENGRSLPATSRTPIELKGIINGDRIEATFSEQGLTRKTNGRIVWKIDRAGGLTGTFASTAARTSGRSTATREL